MTERTESEEFTTKSANIKAKENETGEFTHQIVELNEEESSPQGATTYQYTNDHKETKIFYLKYQSTDEKWLPEKRSLESLINEQRLSKAIISEIQVKSPKLLNTSPLSSEVPMLRRVIAYMLEKNLTTMNDAQMREFDQLVLERLKGNKEFIEAVALALGQGTKSIEINADNVKILYDNLEWLESMGAIVTLHIGNDKYGKAMPGSHASFMRETKGIDSTTFKIKLSAGFSPESRMAINSLRAQIPEAVTQPTSFSPTRTKTMALMLVNGEELELPTETGQIPFGDVNMALFASALHYAFEGFEGLKAVKGKDGKVRIPNLEEAVNRMLRTLENILAIPKATIDKLNLKDQIRKAILNNVNANKEYIPEPGKGVYYVRPFADAIAEVIGVKATEDKPKVMISVIGAVVADYMGKDPVEIVNAREIRAVKGSGNKGGFFYPGATHTDKALASKGRALYRDEKNRITEGNGTNFFAIYQEGEKFIIKTPSVDHDRTLPGNTRAAIIKLAKILNGDPKSKYFGKLEVQETDLYEKDFKTAVGGFLSGTAAGIVPIKGIRSNPQQKQAKQLNDESHQNAYNLVNFLKSTWEAMLNGETIPDSLNNLQNELITVYDPGKEIFVRNNQNYNLVTGILETAAA